MVQGGLSEKLFQLLVLFLQVARLRMSLICTPPYLAFHLYSVCSEIPWRRHTSCAFSPALASPSTLMICSSVNLLFFKSSSPSCVF